MIDEPKTEMETKQPEPPIEPAIEAQPTEVEPVQVIEVPKESKKDAYAKAHTTIAIEREIAEWLKANKKEGERNVGDVIKRLRASYQESQK